MSVSIMLGDCRIRMKELADASVDSVVCDPPYHLTSIVKRFGSPTAAPAKIGKTGAYARHSTGFMGQKWDGGDIAQDPAMWAEVLRVLKPGGHLVAFSGTRTYHRMAVAIEDTGFEIRDQLAWVYGSGFPKSLDVSKAIDKRGGADIGWFGPWLRIERRKRGISSNTLSEHFPSKTGNNTGCVRNWELGNNLPTPQQFNTLCRVLDLPFDGIAAAEREVIGQREGNLLAVAPGQANDRSRTVLDITAASSAAAQQWQGWGTALKPSWEPICLARKPLDGTVAGNILKHGVGALNIDGCRIEGDEVITTHSRGSTTSFAKRPGENTVEESGRTVAQNRPEFIGNERTGRWPANLCHDGSDEVLAGFPDVGSGSGVQRKAGPGAQPFATDKGWNQHSMTRDGQTAPEDYGDSGSAARFFYCAKATSDERGEGNLHPTVKPQALMRWLARLVTPPGGTILDPFMGSGSTLIAADAEQFNAIGIEMSPEYAAIAERRIRDAAGMFADVRVAA